MTREFGYYRMKNSRVWHFFTGCRYWIAANVGEKGTTWVAYNKHRGGGTLCDYCQKGEKKARAAGKRMKP
jgi:hypothetical protein